MIRRKIPQNGCNRSTNRRHYFENACKTGKGRGNHLSSVRKNVKKFRNGPFARRSGIRQNAESVSILRLRRRFRSGRGSWLLLAGAAATVVDGAGLLVFGDEECSRLRAAEG